MKTLQIVKIGGNVIDNPQELSQFLKLFSDLSYPKILVHGGGKLTTEFSKKLGLTPQMINGRRITNKETLEVATMVYAGLINKNIVTQLQSFDCNSIGISGADMATIQSQKRNPKPIDFGFVGDVEKVNSNPIKALLELNCTPVFCALTHDGKGQLLNTNADTIASEIAVAISEHYHVELLYCFGKKGVLKDSQDDNSVICHIDKTQYEDLVAQNIITDGMLPKMQNCFYALEKGVKKVCIGNTQMLKKEENTIYTTLTLNAQ